MSKKVPCQIDANTVVMVTPEYKAEFEAQQTELREEAKPARERKAPPPKKKKVKRKKAAE